MELSQILVVDDAEADRFLHTYRLGKTHPEAQVRTAVDGQDALEILREPGYRPDLILLDINMPRMNGFEFLEIYSVEFVDAPSGVVVMLTSSLSDKDKARARSFAVVKGFLSKPLGDSWPELLNWRP